MSQQISIIVAMSLNRVIGHKGGMPWHIPKDLKRFKKLTLNHSVIMGRKTYESIIEKIGYPLKSRFNIVITSQPDYEVEEGCIVVNSLEKALKEAGDGEVFVIGGGQIYKLALPVAKKLYVTLVQETFKGDTFFPKTPKSSWKLIVQDYHYENNLDFSFIVWEKQGFVNLGHARTKKQTQVMEQIVADGVCPFCMENFLTYHTEPIILNGKWWVVTKNFEPYNGTKFHFLIVYKYHIVKPSELNIEAGAELFTLLSQLEKMFNLDGGSLIMRFGNTDYTGATVEHLHVQIVVGETSRSNPRSSSLKVKLGYKLEK